MMYVGLWQINEINEEVFLGDYELDLQPYFKEDVET